MAGNETAHAVHDFYQTLHFNEGASAEADAARLDAAALVAGQLTSPLPQTAAVLRECVDGCLIADVGCGVGWLALALAEVCPGADVLGLDFSERALGRAEAMRDHLGSGARFARWDILDADACPRAGRAGFLVSMGALHHAGDFPVALANCLACVGKGGHAVIGLYHAHRRRPFLARMAELADASPEERRAAYFALDRRSDDPVRRESWYLDQVEHPHETQHTLAAVLALAGPAFEHVENTITGATLPDAETLGRIEARQEALGAANLARGVYDPGFFLVHLRRVE